MFAAQSGMRRHVRQADTHTQRKHKQRKGFNRLQYVANFFYIYFRTPIFSFRHVPISVCVCVRVRVC